nr:serine-rich adhesin for platelets-like isoform X2 [Procambarus clarkii]XP_045600330.1 serine-rich adhesin for platelets-like isoform X2 [Procambarus clarkii]
MATSSKKITYTSDFKLKVLDYYFKNGGDENFGLKKKTAGHFNIDKKTINRMLNNPEMVKRARKLLSKRVTGSTKGTAASRPGGTKATVKGTKASGSKVSTSGAKLGAVSASSKVPGSSHTSASNTSSSILKASTSSTSSTKNVGISNKNSQASGSGTHTAFKPSTSKIKFMGQDMKSGVQVFDLPEDPDYSILKKSINASVNGVANVARLLVTGTEEVCKIILNECDMILECKVCHNLFRSVVNFIAHKRIYCQEEFANVRVLFHKDDIQGITSHSNTVFVEPEPPPDVHPSTSSAPDKITKSAKSAMQGASRHSGIDSIAAKLAKRRKQRTKSHATHTGSSQYYERLDRINMARDKLSRDCSVVLEDIGGVTNARYQTFMPPSSTVPNVSMNAIIDEVSQHSAGLTVAINEHGEIVKTAPGNVRTIDVEQPTSSSGISKELICHTCNTRFATQKTLSVHQRSHHGFERCIYCCPICKANFLSMWAVVKHLKRFHKKKKSQTERLRKVIRKNVYKKMVYHSEDHQGEYCEKTKKVRGKEKFPEGDQEAMEEIDMEENGTFDESIEMEIASPHKSSLISGSRKCSPTKSPLKGWRSKEGVRWMCNVCQKMFITRAASLAHVATHIICNFEPKAVLVNIETGTRVKNPSSICGNSNVDLSCETSENESDEMDDENEYDSKQEQQPQDVEELKDTVIQKTWLKNKRKNRKTVQRIIVDEPASEIEGKNTDNSSHESYCDLVLGEHSENHSEIAVDERERLEHSSSITNDDLKITAATSSESVGSELTNFADNEGLDSKESDHYALESSCSSESSKEETTMEELTNNQLATPTRVSSGNILSSEEMDVDLADLFKPSLNFASISYPDSRCSGSYAAKSSWESQSEEDVHKAATKLRLFEEDWSRSETPSELEGDTEEPELEVGSLTSEQVDRNKEPEEESKLTQRPSVDGLNKVHEVAIHAESTLHDALNKEVESSSLDEIKERVGELPPVSNSTSPALDDTIEEKANEPREENTTPKQEVMDEVDLYNDETSLHVDSTSHDTLDRKVQLSSLDKVKEKESLPASTSTSPALDVPIDIKTEEVREEDNIPKQDMMDVDNNIKKEIQTEEELVNEDVNVKHKYSHTKIESELIKVKEEEILNENTILKEGGDTENVLKHSEKDESIERHSLGEHHAHTLHCEGITDDHEDKHLEMNDMNTCRFLSKGGTFDTIKYSVPQEINLKAIHIDQPGDKVTSHSDEGQLSEQSGKECNAGLVKTKETDDAECVIKPSVAATRIEKTVHLTTSKPDVCANICAQSFNICRDLKSSVENLTKCEINESLPDKLRKPSDHSPPPIQQECNTNLPLKRKTYAFFTTKSKTARKSVTKLKASPSVSPVDFLPSCTVLPDGLFVAKLRDPSQSNPSSAFVNLPNVPTIIAQPESPERVASEMPLPKFTTVSETLAKTRILKKQRKKPEPSQETLSVTICGDSSIPTVKQGICTASVVTSDTRNKILPCSSTAIPIVSHTNSLPVTCTVTSAGISTLLPYQTNKTMASVIYPQNTYISTTLTSLPYSSISDTRETESKSTLAAAVLTNTITSVNQPTSESTKSLPKDISSTKVWPKKTTTMVIQPKSTGGFVTQLKTTASVSHPKPTTASESQLRTTDFTLSDTSPRGTTAPTMQSRTGASIISVIQPRIISSPVTQPKIAAAVTWPETTTVSVTQLKTTTTSVAQPRTTTTSMTRPITTTISKIHPKTTTTSVTQPRTSTISVAQPITITTSMTQPRTTATAVTQPRTTDTSVTQPKTTTSSVTQPQTTATSLTEHKSTIAVTQPKTPTASVTQLKTGTTSVSQPRIHSVTVVSAQQIPTAPATWQKAGMASETHPKTATLSVIQPRTMAASVPQPVAITESVTKPKITTASPSHPRATEFVPQNKAVIGSVTLTRPTIACTNQTKISTAPVTHPKTSTAPVISPKATTASVISPKTTTTSVISPKTTTAPVISPKTTTASVIPPKTTTASVIPPKTTTASVIPPKTTTASVIPLRTITASVKPPITTTASVIPPRTTTASVILPKTTKASVTPTRSTTASVILPKTTTASVIPPRTTTTSAIQSKTSIVSVAQLGDTHLIPSISLNQVIATVMPAAKPRTLVLPLTQTKMSTPSIIQPKTVVTLPKSNAGSNILPVKLRDMNTDLTSKTSDKLEVRTNISDIQADQGGKHSICTPNHKTIKNILVYSASDDVSDENKLLSTSGKCYENIVVETGNCDDVLDQFKCELKHVEENITECSMEDSATKTTCTTALQVHTSEVEGKTCNTKGRKEREKCIQHGAESVARVSEVECSNELVKKSETPKYKNIETGLENLEFEGFSDTNIKIKGKIYPKVLHVDFLKAVDELTKEFEKYTDTKVLPSMSVSGGDTKHTATHSRSNKQTQVCVDTDPSLTEFAEKQNNQNNDLIKKELNTEAARDLGSQPGCLVQQSDQITKQEDTNSEKNATKECVATAKSHGLHSKNVSDINPDMTSSSKYKSKLKVTKHIYQISPNLSSSIESPSKLKVNEYHKPAPALLKLKKRKREGCEREHYPLVAENLVANMNVTKKPNSISTKNPETSSVYNEAFMKECKTSGEVEGKKDTTEDKYETVTPKHNLSSNFNESEISEESVLKKVREDWVQLSTNPQWKWRRKEKNKELWKLVIAAKATVNAKKVSQTRDGDNGSLSEGNRCDLSTEEYDDLKELQLAGTSESADQKMSGEKTSGCTAIQYNVKGKKWKEGCPVPKKAKISDECDNAKTNNSGENDLPKDTKFCKESVKDLTSVSRQEENQIISVVCGESLHEPSSSSSQHGIMELDVLEDSVGPDHLITTAGDMTTFDAAAVMRDPTTFGDLSYDYDLH